MGLVYHVKKVSKIFDENWSHNINLEKNCSIAWKVIWKPIVQCGKNGKVAIMTRMAILVINSIRYKIQQLNTKYKILVY